MLLVKLIVSMISPFLPRTQYHLSENMGLNIISSGLLSKHGLSKHPHPEYSGLPWKHSMKKIMSEPSDVLHGHTSCNMI